MQLMDYGMNGIDISRAEEKLIGINFGMNTAMSKRAPAPAQDNHKFFVGFGKHEDLNTSRHAACEMIHYK